MFLKNYEKDLIDFQNVIHLSSGNGNGHVGLADSLKGMGNFKGALQAYTQAIAIDPNYKEQALTKRGILFYQLKNFD